MQTATTENRDLSETQVKPGSTEEQQQQREAALDAAKARRELRKGNQAAGKVAEDGAPITEAATLGMPEAHRIGTALTIHLRAPVIKDAKPLYVKILGTFPDVLIGAAVADSNGRGVDVDVVTAFWNERYGEIPDSVVVNRSDVEDELNAFARSLFDYVPASERDSPPLNPEIAAPDFPSPPPVPHVLDDICDAVWQLADGYNPDLSRETLPGLLIECLRPADFADLLRAVFRACCGCDTRYEGDLVSRFTSP